MQEARVRLQLIHELDVLKTSLTPYAREVLARAGLDLRFEPGGLEGHAGIVDCAALSADGALAVTASSGDGSIRTWNVATRSLLAIHSRGDARFARYGALAIESSGDAIVVADRRGSVERIDARTGRSLAKHSIDPLGFETCALSKNGAFLACAQGTKLEVWSTVTGERISSRDDPDFYDPTDYKMELRAYVFDFDDDDYTGPSERQTRIRDIAVSDDGKAEPRFERPPDELVFEPPKASYATALALAPDGALVVGRYGGTITVHSPTGEIVRTYPPESSERNREVLSVAVSCDGEIAVGRYDASIELHLPGGEVRVVHAGSPNRCIGVRALGWSPDGKLVVGTNDEGRARWAKSDGTRGTFMENDGAACLDIAFDPSGEAFATTSCSKELHVWRVRDRECLHTVRLDDRPTSVAYSPSGNAIAVAVEGRVSVWPVFKGTWGKMTDRVVATLGESTSIGAIAWLDDDLVASGASDGKIHVWSTKDIGPARIVIEGHAAGIEMMLALDTKTLVSAARDGMVARWDLERIAKHGSFSAALSDALG